MQGVTHSKTPRTLEDELHHPAVLEYVVGVAASHVRKRIVAGRIAAVENKKRHKVRLPRAVALPAKSVLEFWDNRSDDQGAADPTLKVLVEFLTEIPGWSGSVFKVRMSLEWMHK